MFTVLYTIMSIISSTIMKLHMGLVLFLNKVYRRVHAGLLKQNHWEQRPMCSTNKQVHRTRKIIRLQEVTWITDGGMLYLIAENELYN